MSGREWVALIELMMLRCDGSGDPPEDQRAPYLLELPGSSAEGASGKEATEQVARLYATHDQRVTDRLPAPGDPELSRVDDLLEPGGSACEARITWLGGHARTVLGRGSECDLYVHDPKVSRRHAAIERLEHGRWAIVDLASSNGTKVQGRRLTPRIAVLLDEEQQVQIGNWRCLVLSAGRLERFLRDVRPTPSLER